MERKHTVLFVDDEPHILSALRRLFRREGYQILTAPGGQEGLALLKEQPVSLILSDQRMPGMIGSEFLAHSREITPHSVRLVFTGYSDIEAAIQAINEGAISRYITKPWDDEELRMTVREALARFELEQHNRELTEELKQKNAALETFNARLEQKVEELRLSNYNLDERIKELNCLYVISKLIEEGDSLEDIVQGTVELIPSSWQFPEITCARITLEDRIYQTGNFKESAWMQSAPIKVNGIFAGRIDVGFLEEKPEAYEGSFLKNERLLLDALAKTLGRITDRKQAEEELQRQKEWLEVTLSSIGDAVMATDTSEKILFMNPVAENLTGWTSQEVLGKDVDEIFRIVNESTHQPAGNPIKRVLEEGHIVGLAHHTALISREGKEVSIADSGAPIIGVDGSIQGVILVFRDVTERKRMEGDLRRAHNLESLGLLAGGIAHDFNNVLTGVMGNLALLVRFLDKDSEEYEIASEAQQAANKTKGLTQQLMTFAKGGAPVKETASVEELIRETTNRFLPGANTKPEFHFADDLSSVDIDTGQIGQVIQNLVINADQAMPNGGTLRIFAENVEVSDETPVPLAPGNYVKVTVADQGMGIPESILAQVFDPYFSTKPKGHGLGLSITHSIMQRHEGHITVSSQQGVGTTFEFYLPASEMPVATTMEPEKAISAGSGRILLMDDEEIIHHIVGRSLKLFGYQVESANDGNEVIQKYQEAMGSEKPFDVVILDLTIPGGMGGKEAVGRLREIDPQARVIVSSGYANDPVMANFSQYGFAGRVAKPVDIEELAGTVKSVLERGE